MYIDIHTHNRNQEDNVCKIININVYGYLNCCGFDLQNNFSLGLHPWKINPQTLANDLRFLDENARYDSIKAIGECGLDKLTETDWELQLKAFQSQIVISERVEKPLIIHCVKAFDELLAIKKDIQPQQTWIVHGFRGKPQQMDQLIKQGFFLSFGALFNNETIREVPVERLFLETDDADTTIKQVYKEVSKQRNIDEQVLIEQITKNFADFF